MLFTPPSFLEGHAAFNFAASCIDKGHNQPAISGRSHCPVAGSVVAGTGSQVVANRRRTGEHHATLVLTGREERAVSRIAESHLYGGAGDDLQRLPRRNVALVGVGREVRVVTGLPGRAPLENGEPRKTITVRSRSARGESHRKQ